MKNYEELEIEVNELEFTNFNFSKQNICYEEMYVTSLLRKASLLYYTISGIENETERSKLINKLNSILTNKIRKMNPNFSDEIIDNICHYFYRGIFRYPIDIFVISDAVLSKEGIYDDFGSIYKVRTFMFNNTNIYFSATDDINFLVSDNIFDFMEKGKIFLTHEDEMQISKFISDSINIALRDKYKGDVCKPVYELNNGKCFYGYDGLTRGDVGTVNIYLNKKFKDIAYDIIKKSECNIKMCVQNMDDISLYNFHQTFKNDKPVWNCKKLDIPIWRLSEAAMEYENNLTSSTKTKSKSLR